MAACAGSDRRGTQKTTCRLGCAAPGAAATAGFWTSPWSAQASLRRRRRLRLAQPLKRVREPAPAAGSLSSLPQRLPCPWSSSLGAPAGGKRAEGPQGHSHSSGYGGADDSADEQSVRCQLEWVIAHTSASAAAASSAAARFAAAARPRVAAATGAALAADVSISYSRMRGAAAAAAFA